MLFDQAVAILERRIKQKLPGSTAQKEMLPKAESVDRFDQQAMARAKTGAVLILFYPDGHNQTLFPLIQRSVYAGAHSGQIALPGGKKDPGDPNTRFTAIREAEEEIGVYGDDINISGKLTDLYVPVSNFLIQPYVGYLPYEPKMIPQYREVKEIIKTPLQVLFDPIQVYKIEIGSMQLNAPGFFYQQKIIWGATAMILSELREILQYK